MTEPERAQALANLEKTRQQFQTAITGVSEAQARFKPSADRWSIEEIVEHVAVSELGMYRLITAFSEASDSPHAEESAAALDRMSDRKTKPFRAPERVKPKGRFGSAQESLAKFLENRERTIDFVRTCQDNLQLRIVDHPAGRMNVVACLKVLAMHPARHVEQIEELKTDPGFPD